MKDSCVVVLGMGPAGLFVVRQLAHLTTNIYAIGRPDDVGMYSKYLDASKKYYAVTADELGSTFSKIYQKEKRRPILYICSDQYLSILLKHCQEWKSYLDYKDINFDTLKLINDKELINRYCQENRIKIPETVPYKLFKEEPFFPSVIKWKEKRIETAVNPIGKIKKCNNLKEFERVDRIISESGIKEADLFVQRFVEGNNSYQYSVGGVYCEGNTLAEVVVNQVRQYPQGISAEVNTFEDLLAKRLSEFSQQFVQKVGYSGFLEIEYKEDAQSGDIYLLDVNPRPWGWVSILGIVYPHFYEVFDGKAPRKINSETTWRSPIRIFLGGRNKQNVKKETSCVKRKKKLVAYDLRDRRDNKPTVMIYVMAVKKILRRLKKWEKGSSTI